MGETLLTQVAEMKVLQHRIAGPGLMTKLPLNPITSELTVLRLTAC